MLLVEELVPGFHLGGLAYGDAYLAQDGGIETLALHIHGHLIDAGYILALHHTFEVNVAEGGDLQAQMVVEVAFGAEYQNVWLDAHPLQLLDAVLGGLGLQFVGSLQIRHIGKVYAYGVATQLPAQLADGLHKGSALNVADGAAHLGDDEVELLVLLVLAQHTTLNLIGDMRHHLNGLAQIVTATLAVDDRLVDAAGGDAVVACGVDTCEALVVT